MQIRQCHTFRWWQLDKSVKKYVWPLIWVANLFCRASTLWNVMWGMFMAIGEEWDDTESYDNEGDSLPSVHVVKADSMRPETMESRVKFGFRSGLNWALNSSVTSPIVFSGNNRRAQFLVSAIFFFRLKPMFSCFYFAADLTLFLSLYSCIDLFLCSHQPLNTTYSCINYVTNI